MQIFFDLIILVNNFNEPTVRIWTDYYASWVSETGLKMNEEKQSREQMGIAQSNA